MIVGFDSDGCLDTFGDGVREALEARGQGHLWKSGPTDHAIWNFHEEWGWTFEQFKELVDWGVDHGYIFKGHWREGALESVKRIKAMGHKTVLITDRSWGSDPTNAQRNTLKAYAEAGFPFDEIHFSSDKLSVHTDVHVEDRIENYDKLVAAGVPTWLINRGWNKVPGGDRRNRIDSIVEFADAVERITAQGYVDLQLV